MKDILLEIIHAKYIQWFVFFALENMRTKMIFKDFIFKFIN
jgi:hypothetical protein